jgi:hypothetical protein
MKIEEPKVLWFRTTGKHHAFEIKSDGTVDVESCCGGIDLDWCADEPARALPEFDDVPACAPCLAVVELKVPGSA